LIIDTEKGKKQEKEQQKKSPLRPGAERQIPIVVALSGSPIREIRVKKETAQPRLRSPMQSMAQIPFFWQFTYSSPPATYKKS